MTGTSLRAFQRFDRDLVANASTIVDVTGTYLSVLDSDGAFEVGLDANPFVQIPAGVMVALPPGETFKRVRLRDLSGAANTVSIVVGYGDFKDQRLTVSGALDVSKATTLTSTADVAIAATTNAQIRPANSARREAIIKNLVSNSDAIRIGDAAAAAGEGHELMPGESIVLTTTAEIRGFNTGAAAQSVSVIETRD